MAANDLFAPPTKEELAKVVPVAQAQPAAKQDLFAPPSADEIAKVKGAPAKSDSWLDTQLPLGTTPRGFIHGGLNTLPMVGMVGGGVAGTVMGGPGGGILGAGAGGGTGEYLKTLGERMLGDKKRPGEEFENASNAVGGGMLAEGGGQVIGNAIKTPAAKWIGNKALSAAGSSAEALTGIPKEVINTYAGNAPEIKAMQKSSGGDMALAANDMRSKFSNAIDQTRKGLNDQLSAALDRSENSIDGRKVLQGLQDAKTHIDPDLQPEQFKQIDEMADRVSKKMGDDSQMSVQDAHKVKQYLQQKASSAYRSPGEIFFPGSATAKAAKSGAGVSRGLINDVEPDIASANNKLSQLHDSEDVINPNLVTPDKPHSALLAAGSGGNAQNAQHLQDLGNLTGTDMLGGAQKLSALNTFGKPELLPIDKTGKAVGRMVMGPLLGGAAGYAHGGEHEGMIGLGLGSALTSPAALKVAIDSGLLGKEAMETLTSSQGGRNLLGQALTSMRSKPAPQIMGPPTSDELLKLSKSASAR